ncbi:MAG: hypothetical protein ACP5OP_09195, partial [Leptospirillia bacterium]
MGQVAAGSVGENMSQTMESYLGNSMNIQPTLKIRPGYRFDITVPKHGLSGSVSREGRLIRRRKSFEDLAKRPIVTRVPDSSCSRLKELAKEPSRRSLNALMTEIMDYFLREKHYEKGLKFRIPRFTIRFENGNPVRTGWMQFN